MVEGDGIIGRVKQHHLLGVGETRIVEGMLTKGLVSSTNQTCIEEYLEEKMGLW